MANKMRLVVCLVAVVSLGAGCKVSSPVTPAGLSPKSVTPESPRKLLRDFVVSPEYYRRCSWYEAAR